MGHVVTDVGFRLVFESRYVVLKPEPRGHQTKQGWLPRRQVGGVTLLMEIAASSHPNPRSLPAQGARGVGPG